MPIITLTSDYGLIDYRVAAIKGILLGMNSDTKICDISHHITAYDLLQAAQVVKYAYPFFPKGSIHIICVDSFYHPEKKNVLYFADGHYFIASDNGVLSLIFSQIKPDQIWEITYNTRFGDVIDFPATDIFAPVASHLMNGGLPEVVGRKFTHAKQLSTAKAGSKDNLIFGEVLYIDNFGNIVSNIEKKLFDKLAAASERFTIKFRSLALSKVYSSYSELVSNWADETSFHGKPAAVFNRMDVLELTIYKGSKENGAKTLFGMKVGEKIYIEFD